MKDYGYNPKSPCIKNCCLDDNDICVGCFRSLSEITAWGMADDQTRQAILRATKIRRNKQEANPQKNFPTP